MSRSRRSRKAVIMPRAHSQTSDSESRWDSLIGFKGNSKPLQNITNFENNRPQNFQERKTRKHPLNKFRVEKYDSSEGSVKRLNRGVNVKKFEKDLKKEKRDLMLKELIGTVHDMIDKIDEDKPPVSEKSVNGSSFIFENKDKKPKWKKPVSKSNIEHRQYLDDDFKFENVSKSDSFFQKNKKKNSFRKRFLVEESELFDNNAILGNLKPKIKDRNEIKPPKPPRPEIDINFSETMKSVGENQFNQIMDKIDTIMNKCEKFDDFIENSPYKKNMFNRKILVEHSTQTPSPSKSDKKNGKRTQKKQDEEPKNIEKSTDKKLSNLPYFGEFRLAERTPSYQSSSIKKMKKYETFGKKNLSSGRQKLVKPRLSPESNIGRSLPSIQEGFKPSEAYIQARNLKFSNKIHPSFGVLTPIVETPKMPTPPPTKIILTNRNEKKFLEQDQNEEEEDEDFKEEMIFLKLSEFKNRLSHILSNKKNRSVKLRLNLLLKTFSSFSQDNSKFLLLPQLSKKLDESTNRVIKVKKLIEQLSGNLEGTFEKAMFNAVKEDIEELLRLIIIQLGDDYEYCQLENLVNQVYSKREGKKNYGSERDRLLIQDFDNEESNRKEISASKRFRSRRDESKKLRQMSVDCLMNNKNNNRRNNGRNEKLMNSQETLIKEKFMATEANLGFLKQYMDNRAITEKGKDVYNNEEFYSSGQTVDDRFNSRAEKKSKKNHGKKSGFVIEDYNPRAGTAPDTEKYPRNNNYYPYQNQRKKSKNENIEKISNQKFGCKIYSMNKFEDNLLIGFEDGGLSVFSYEKSEGISLIKSNRHYSEPLTSITVNHANSQRRIGQIMTAYASQPPSIIIWNYPELKAAKEMLGHEGLISDMLTISNDYLVSCSFDKNVIFWDLNNYKGVLSMDTHQSPILCCSYEPKTECLYTGSLDSLILVTGLEFQGNELVDCKLLRKIKGSGPVTSIGNLGLERLLTFENSKMRVYDSRGVLYKDINTHCLPKCFQMIDHDKGVVVDVSGDPFLFSMDFCLSGKGEPFQVKYNGRGKDSMQSASQLLARKLNGCGPKSQLLQDGPFLLVASVNGKNDSISIYRVKK